MCLPFDVMAISLPRERTVVAPYSLCAILISLVGIAFKKSIKRIKSFCGALADAETRLD
jgi:hypothetical protein